jgi:hypothetical protein
MLKKKHDWYIFNIYYSKVSHLTSCILYYYSKVIVFTVFGFGLIKAKKVACVIYNNKETDKVLRYQ